MTKQQRKMGACSRKCTGTGSKRVSCMRTCLRSGRRPPRYHKYGKSRRSR